jgi:hypothetical protein
VFAMHCMLVEADDEGKCCRLCLLELKVCRSVCMPSGLKVMHTSRQSAMWRKTYLKAILRQDVGWYDVNKASELSTLGLHHCPCVVFPPLSAVLSIHLSTSLSTYLSILRCTEEDIV